MEGMGKMISLLVLTISCGCLGTGLVGNPGPYTINGLENGTQTWKIDAVDPEKNSVSFKDSDDSKIHGAINVSLVSGDATAAKVSFIGDLTDEDKKDLFLVLDFQNEPSVDVTEISADEKAHIYAYTRDANATALHLDDGVNLKFIGSSDSYKIEENLANQKRIGIFACSESTDQNCETVGIELEEKTGDSLTGEFDQTFIFEAPTEIYAKSANGVAVAIGKASYDSDIDLIENIQYQIGDNNEFTPSLSTSTSASSSAVIGVASYSGQAKVGGNIHEYVINGNNNRFISSSHYSVVIGASSFEGNASVDVKNAVYDIAGSDNIFTSSSAASVSVVLGAVADGSASVEGYVHEYKINGSNNTFTSSSSEGVSVVMGAASYDKSASVNVKNAIYKIGGKNNIFASYGNSSVVVGAVSHEDTATVEGSNVCEIDNGNVFTSVAASDGIFSPSSTVFGTASVIRESIAKNMFINMNGAQVLSALAYDQGTAKAKINVFGADVTDAEDGKTGWRIGIYNDDEVVSATVNILGARLAEQVALNEGKDLIMKLDVGQGRARTDGDDASFGNNNYARAFALGKDYQIYIGGKCDIEKDVDGKFANIGTDLKPAGYGDNSVINIFGAVVPAQKAALTDNYCEGSSLTIDKNWTANVYGPIEGLERMIVHGGGRINAYGRIKNIKTIQLENGVLHFMGCNKDVLNSAFSKSVVESDLKPRIAVAQEDGSVENCEINEVTLDGDYNDDFANGGKLVLGRGETLQFYIDVDDVNEEGVGKVNGMIKIDEMLGATCKLNNVLDFQEGSRLEIVETRKNGALGTARDPGVTSAKFVLIQGENLPLDKLLDGEDFKYLKKTGDNTWTLESGDIDIIVNEVERNDSAPEGEANSGGTTVGAQKSFVKNMVKALYARVGVANGPDDERTINFEQKESGTQIFVTKRANPPDPDPEAGFAEVNTASSSAQITTAVVSMFRNAVAVRLTDVKGNGNDPFVSAIGGHVHQSSIAGIGYGGDLYGVTAGADKLLNYKDGCVRLGAMIGYIYGDVNFHGSAIGKKQKSKQDNYLGALYGAYEAFNEKNLKTDLNLSCGFGYTKHRLNRVDQQGAGYNAKMKSNNFFLSAEFIKNLYAVQGIQFGLWLRADYNHIHQKAYSENGGAGAQSISKAKFDFLDTTVGVNIEKEIQNSSNSDRSLRLYMKAGWNCQPVRSHSTIVAGVNGKDSVVSPHFGSHNSAVFTAGLRQKLNARWDLIGEWNGSFNKKHSNNLVTLGAGYTF